MQDDSSVYVINKNNNELLEKEAKVPKRENGENTEDSNSLSSSQTQHAFRVAKKYKVMSINKSSLYIYIFIHTYVLYNTKSIHYVFIICSISPT